MDKEPDNRVFFDHGGLTAFDDGKNQLLKPAQQMNIQKEFHQEVSDNSKFAQRESYAFNRIRL